MTDNDCLRVLRSTPALLLVVRPDDRFTIVDASDAYLRATYTEREAVAGRPIFEVFPDNPDDASADGVAKLRASLERVRATRREDTMAVQKYDVRRPQAAGGGFEERWWSPVNAPVLSESGELAYIVHRVEDATQLVALQRREAEDRARIVEANNTFQAIYDQGIFAGRLDLEGRVVDVNRSSLEQCGFRREDVIGKPFWECGWWNRSPEVQARVKRAVVQAIAGEAFRGESRYFVADGGERVADLACMPIKDESGRVQFVVPTGIDITDRVTTERDLRATEILDSITEGFFAIDSEWHFSYVNREAKRILGAESEGLIGRSLWEAYPGLRGTAFEDAYVSALEGRNASAVVAYYPDHQRWYEVHAYPAGKGASIYFRDVTEVKSAEHDRQRLAAESETQRRIFETALANIPDLVYIFGLDHRFTYANESLLRMWGIPLEQAMGKTCLELGYPQWEAELHDREIDEVIATRAPIHGEVPFEGATGLHYWDYIFAPVLGPDGDVVAVVGTARDSTERRRAEEAIAAQAARLREADRAKDEFIATLSHELRNPLAPLRNSVHMLRMGAASDERAARIHDMMGRQIEHLVRLVDDLLEISRVTRGDFALRRERVALAPVVRNALETSEPTVRARRHRLSVSLPEAAVWLDADPVRLAQVIANLVDNAAKYTPPGGNIDVSASVEGGVAAVRVRDDGAGIAAEDLPRVFEMFNRGNRANVQGEGGLGIGLALSRRLAAMHGGTLEAVSAGAGQGSEFTLRLQLAQAPGDSAAVTRPLSLHMTTRPILVVDDNRDAAESLGMLLEQLGARVRIVNDGAQALAACDEFEPAAVLLDIGMPDMDGYEVARTLRAKHPARRTPLIALTGWGQEQDRARAVAAGFDHHIVKPADIEVLQGLLSRIEGPAD